MRDHDLTTFSVTQQMSATVSIDHYCSKVFTGVTKTYEGLGRLDDNCKKVFNPCAAGTVYMWFKLILDQ